ncbi:MAG: glycosyltransferase WbuB [Candidatus Electrothrix sp. AR3]|nr:glycosyltransferase WbuB [Candidatus Electrothrix sp. AR3]
MYVDMRICYINYSRYGIIGPLVHAGQFLAELKKIHHDLVVDMPLSQQDEKKSFFAEKVMVDNLREVRLLLVMITRRTIHEISLLRRVKPDVVILRQGRYLSAIILCRLMKIPLIVEVNGPVLEDQFAPKKQRIRGGAFWQWLEIKMLSIPDHIMVVSETLKGYYVNCGIPYEKITSVPNGVDIHTFHPEVSGERVRKKLGLQGKTIIGFSGNFAPWHGLHLLADAMKTIHESNKYKDLALLLIGKPGELFTMPDFPDAITTFTGHIPHEEMPEYLAVIDIFIAPYPEINPFYFSPLKIFEAMSMGKPVIASAQGQICELITDQVSGLLYPPRDQTALINAIESLIIDPLLKDKLGRQARTVMETKFTWKNNARKMLDLCKQVRSK